MFQFITKLLLLLTVLLFGILLGIQQAEQGILSIQGISSEQKPTKAEEVYISKIDGDDVEVVSIEDRFSTATIEEKKEIWQNRYHHNKWSQLGNRLGELFYTVSRKSIDWVINQIDKLV